MRLWTSRTHHHGVILPWSSGCSRGRKFHCFYMCIICNLTWSIVKTFNMPSAHKNSLHPPSLVYILICNALSMCCLFFCWPNEQIIRIVVEKSFSFVVLVGALFLRINYSTKRFPLGLSRRHWACHAATDLGRQFHSACRGTLSCVVAFLFGCKIPKFHFAAYVHT